jgi:hypothetical protein
MVILEPPMLRTRARDNIGLALPRAKTILSPIKTSLKLVRGVVATII